MMTNSNDCSPIGVRRANGFTRFKWHRARRHSTDFPFSVRNILDGLSLGASVEIDVIQHGSPGFAVLHDIQVENETSGTGSARNLDDNALHELWRRAPNGDITNERVLTLIDLANQILKLKSEKKLSRHSLLQIDLKDHSRDIRDDSYGVFQNSIKDISDNIILSGDDKDALKHLKGDLADLRLGYDPCYGQLLTNWFNNFDHRRFIEDTIQEMPEAKMVYIEKNIFLRALDDGYSMADALHDRGIEIDVYTLAKTGFYEQDLATRLIRANVDQITTDDPEGLAHAIEEISSL